MMSQAKAFIIHSINLFENFHFFNAVLPYFWLTSLMAIETVANKYLSMKMCCPFKVKLHFPNNCIKIYSLGNENN
jgi:hypothetical protein